MSNKMQLSGLTDLQRSWCFLTLRAVKHDSNVAISGWEICYGDLEKIIYKVTGDKPDEKELLRGLLFHLSLCKKNKIPVVTFRNDVIPIIRTLLLSHTIRVNLRDLEVISLQKILDDYFYISKKTSLLTAPVFASNMKFNIDNVTGTELLRDIFLRIRLLLPTEVIL